MIHHSTVLAISGEDYAIIASDTRLSEGYSIHCRDSPKIYQLCVRGSDVCTANSQLTHPPSLSSSSSRSTEQCALGVAGFHGDILTFVKRLRVRIKVYHQTHGIVMRLASGFVACRWRRGRSTCPLCCCLSLGS